MAIFNVYVRY